MTGRDDDVVRAVPSLFAVVAVAVELELELVAELEPAAAGRSAVAECAVVAAVIAGPAEMTLAYRPHSSEFAPVPALDLDQVVVVVEVVAEVGVAAAAAAVGD